MESVRVDKGEAVLAREQHIWAPPDHAFPSPLSWPCTDIEQEFFEGMEADFTPLGSFHGALLHDLTHSSDSAVQAPSM